MLLHFIRKVKGGIFTNTLFSFGKFQNYLNHETFTIAQSIIDQIYKVGSYPYYFPEYVLHGFEHIQNVLKYVEKLIPDNSFDCIYKLNKSVFDVLVLSVLLHDIAMFIDNYGFEMLLKNKKWSDRFNEFIAILKKADDKTLDRIYGSINGAFDEEINLKILGRRENMFKKENIYTVGEFLREYHHEIAYDIAVNGFPRKDRRDEYLSSIFFDKYKKIIGFISKAHRGNLRKIVEEAELEQVVFAEQGYSPYNIPFVYLMGVLWVADEIDDKAYYRASYNDMLDKELISFSNQQWEDNMCIKDTTFVSGKPLVFFHATPKNTSQFLRVQSYLKKVQSAIDQSIAAIVEFYGQRNTELNLSVIRVKSNIDSNLDKYSFLPVDASLRINPEIIKLLISPLYGDNKAFAVRELLSNAIDACYEREAVDMDYTGKAKIFCQLNLFSKKLTIIDNGIGMTSDIIVNYFMTVGASLRNSLEWKLRHTDDNGYTKIPRLGRFGIGVLSAFLLGNEIEIETRHYCSAKGFKFSFKLDGCVPNINIIDCPIGTKITIGITSEGKVLGTSAVMWFFPIGEKYNYGIPHYPFSYPLCLYDFGGSVFFKSNIYYYDNHNFLREYDFNAVKIRIGSLLNTGNILPAKLHEGSSELINADNFKFKPFKIRHGCYYNQDDWVEYNFASIEKIYYNGMLIEYHSKLPKTISELIEYGLIIKPLYLAIEDNTNSASMDLTKTRLFEGEALHRLRKVESFFQMMLPLVVDGKYLEDILGGYPFIDVIAREITLADFEKKTGTMFGFLQLPRKMSSDFVFEYEPENCISEKNECGDISKAIKEWLVVSEGYEQDYKVPYGIIDRREKFAKAFAELDRYLVESINKRSSDVSPDRQ